MTHRCSCGRFCKSPEAKACERKKKRTTAKLRKEVAAMMAEKAKSAGIPKIDGARDRQPYWIGDREHGENE